MDKNFLDKGKCLNGTYLKLIAMVLMFIDHSGFILFNDNSIMRSVGRLSFPIFAFCISEGIKHTHNMKRYIQRLFVFALISALPYVLICNNQNILWTFLFSSLCVCILKQTKYGACVKIIIVIGIMLVAELVRADYGSYGIMVVIMFYMFGNSLYSYLGLFILTLCFYGLNIQLWCVMSAFVLMLYNNKKGRGMKYFFYVFYPLHLFVLWIIRVLITTS